MQQEGTETFHVAVYGSLREGEYNYERFKDYFPKGIKAIVTAELEGYKLYDLGPYPGVKEATKQDAIIVDVLELSRECFHNIDLMEKGANYFGKQVKVAGYDCTIYVYKGTVNEDRLVKHGDWTKTKEMKQESVITV